MCVCVCVHPNRHTTYHDYDDFDQHQTAATDNHCVCVCMYLLNNIRTT